ncbi:hypothetical protein [Streptomyces sp. NPDC002845]
MSVDGAPHHVLGACGFTADPLTGQRTAPHAATVPHLLQCVDGDALDAAISAYLQAGMPPLPQEPRAGRPVLRAVAVDGKTVRGLRTATATTAAVQLLSAMSHSGVVIAQRQISSKATKSPPSSPCWTPGLTNTVITTDALHTQHRHGTHYRLFVDEPG